MEQGNRGRRTRRAFVVALVALGVVGLGDVGGAAAQTLPPTIAVAPFTDLVDRQVVQVGGFGFAPHAQLAISQCKAGVADDFDCDFSTSKFFPANQHGAFKRKLEVRRVIRTGGGEVIDCASANGACVIGGGYPDGSAGAAFALHFDADVPLPPPPTVTVDPDENLLHGQSVTVAGSGFAPESDLQIVMCLAGSDPFVFPTSCSFSASEYAFTDGAGAFSHPTNVRRIVVDANGTRVDCATAAGTCEMVVTSYEDPLGIGRVPLAFDASAPPPPPPTVKVRPRHHLTNGQQVTVSGTGFSPNAQIGITQCREGATDVNGCDLGVILYVSSDADGNFRTLFTVHSRIVVAGETVRCRSHKGACVLGAGNVGDVSGEQGGEPIGFATRAES